MFRLVDEAQLQQIKEKSDFLVIDRVFVDKEQSKQRAIRLE